MNEVTIRSKIRRNYEPIYDDIGFRHVLEEHYDWLYQRSEIQPVDQYNAQRFSGDFYGYLESQQIPFSLHWLFLRLNNMVYPSDFNESMPFIIKPKEEDIQTLVGQFTMLKSVG